MHAEDLMFRNGPRHPWGCCPECAQEELEGTGPGYFVGSEDNTSGSYINLGKDHWFYCDKHKLRWLMGSNMFSSWEHETEEEQKAIYDRLDFGSFKIIKESGCPHLAKFPWPADEEECEAKIRRLEDEAAAKHAHARALRARMEALIAAGKLKS